MERRPLRKALLLSGMMLRVSLVHAEPNIALILSSEQAPFQEALVGFKEFFSNPVVSMYQTKNTLFIDPSSKLIITFGGLAARGMSSSEIPLIYCMAPGTHLNAHDHAGRLIEIAMIPSPRQLLIALKQIQPSMKRLAVPWISNPMYPLIQELREECRTQQIELVSVHLERPDVLASELRSLQGHIDALWIPPDPILMDEGTFLLLKEFSWSAHIPFYVPSKELVGKGALAAVSSNFKQIGHQVGLTAQAVLNNQTTSALVYPEEYEVTTNPTAAAHLKITLFSNEQNPTRTEAP